MIRTLGLALILATGCSAPPTAKMAPPLEISWGHNLLAVTGNFPGGRIETLYLEAFCRPGARDRGWTETVIPHTTEKVSGDGRSLVLRSRLQGDVQVTHEITAGPGEVDFRLEATNRGSRPAEVQWAQ